jgi:uncharacterized membrane protein YgdD (TMEM256/DUF423 family)
MNRHKTTVSKANPPFPMTQTSTRSRRILIAAAIFGLTGVALGAFGAHGLAAKLNAAGMMHAWETAARYHLLTAIALVGAGAWARVAPAAAVDRIAWVARLWSIGTVLFSGSLYGIALGGPRWLGPVTPFGGLALLAGWGWVIAAALAKED